MRTQVAAVLLALAAPLHALLITSPGPNDVVDPAAGVTVKWTRVSTDALRANLVLTNMASGHTPYTKNLGEVDLSSGSIVVTQKDVPDDTTYQFNLEKTDDSGIYAQSQQFEVKAGNKQSTTSKSGSSTTSATTHSSSTATASKAGKAASSTNAAAVPTCMALQGGMIALVAGVAAVFV